MRAPSLSNRNTAVRSRQLPPVQTKFKVPIQIFRSFLEGKITWKLGKVLASRIQSRRYGDYES